MDLIKHNNPKFMCFCILVLSISFVFVQGISYGHFNFSVAASQGDSQNGIGSSDPDTSKDSENSGQGTGDLPDGSNLGETDGPGSSVTGGLSGDTNQTSQTQSQMTNQAGSQTTNQNGSQTTNQNLDQTTNQNASQTTNQNVDQTTNQNVNQTTDQNVNVQTDQNVNVEMKQRLEIAISEEEGEAPISVEEQNRIESIDRDVVTQHKSLTGPDCKTGNVLAGASNAEDLRVLTECQDATGTVMHTKKMDDGDYKFFLNVDEQFKFLVNEKNDEKTDGFLVVEIVPSDQGNGGVILPKDGERVHVWGAWVTDKPKGWHEIHPTWKVVNE